MGAATSETPRVKKSRQTFGKFFKALLLFVAEYVRGKWFFWLVVQLAFLPGSFLYVDYAVAVTLFVSTCFVTVGFIFWTFETKRSSSGDYSFLSFS